VPLAPVNGIDIYYEEHGEGDPILCIHGTSSSALVWEDAARVLASHGRCIVYDRRGSFRSERPRPYETFVGEHADDAAALIDSLSAAPAIVIGRSYGGEVALDLARRYPESVKAMALLEPAILSLSAEGRAWLQPVVEKATTAAADDISSVAQAFLQEVVDDQTWAAFPDELKRMFRGNGPAILAELRGGPLNLTMQELGEIRQPTLMVSATESPGVFRNIDRILADALPNCDSVLIDGNHLISPSHPSVLEFVDRLVARTAIR
jgi:pimeloyl-ACP methyl ester carboxylesterase